MSHVHDSQRAREPKHAHALPDPLTDPQEASLGTLVSDLSEQLPALIRSEIRLAQAEVAEKGKRAGIGVGMFSVAGLMGFFGLAMLLVALVLLLDLVLPAWAAALVVAAILFAVAGVAALLGKRKVAEAAPATPERAVSGIKRDVATLKGERR